MNLSAIAGRLRHTRVLVVGDLLLDRMLAGRAVRLSREAPIPILEETRREDRPGGGSAPAMHLLALGAAVDVVGVVGADADGERLCDLLAQAGADVSGVVLDGARPTAVKTRVVAEGLLVYPQQVARLDRVDRTPLPGSVEREVIAAIERAVAGKVAAVLVSDYQGGMTTPKILAAVRAAHTRTFIAADAQVDPARFAGFDLIRCNEAEAERALGIPVTAEAVTSARARLGCRILAVTRGPETALLAHPDGLETAPAANRTDVYDVTGAGDAVAAVLTTALALDASPAAALTLAQLAGGISVRKWGNVPVTAEELEAAADAWDRRAG